MTTIQRFVFVAAQSSTADAAIAEYRNQTRWSRAFRAIHAPQPKVRRVFGTRGL